MLKWLYLGQAIKIKPLYFLPLLSYLQVSGVLTHYYETRVSLIQKDGGGFPYKNKIVFLLLVLDSLHICLRGQVLPVR